MLRKVRISLSRMACLGTFRGLCPPRHPGRLSGPPELPPGALGSCRQRFFPGLHVPAETFLFPYAGFVGLKVCTELPDSFFRNKVEPRSRTGPDRGGRAVGKLSSNRRRNRRQTVVEPSGNRRRKPRFWGTVVSLNKGREGSLRRHFSGLGGGCHKRATSQAQCMYFPFHGGWCNGELRVFRRAGGGSRSTRRICRQNRDFTKDSRLKVCTDFPGPLSGGVRTPWLLREIGTI